MGFECPDRSLGCIASVDIWWDELVLGLPFFSNIVLVLTTGLIVQDLEVNLVASGLESLHDVVVGFYSVFVFAGFKRRM